MQEFSLVLLPFSANKIVTITTEVIWRSQGISSIPRSQSGNTNGAATVTMKSPRLWSGHLIKQTPSYIDILEYMSLQSHCLPILC